MFKIHSGAKRWGEKLISKEGYPTRYQLKQEIIDEVQKRKQISEKDAFRMRVRAIIEFKAIEETLLKKHKKTSS